MMKKQPFLRSIGRKSLKKPVAIGIGLILVIIIFFINVYLSVQNDKTKTFSESKSEAIQNSPLTTVQSVERFHGHFHFDVVSGIDESGQKGYVFLPKNTDQSIVFVYENEGKSKEAILTNWESQCSDCQLVKISLAIDQERPLWELVYIDAENRYVFDYYTYKDGTKYEQFSLKKVKK